jgi:serine/threonine protein kinase/tetratricopeptide (TPR) repeat protein
MNEDEDSAYAEVRVGAVVAGAYRLDTLIGVGVIATVYGATHRDGTRVALKLLHPDLVDDEVARERFLQEGSIASQIDHRGCLRVLGEEATEDGVPFLVLEPLEGHTVEALCQERGPRLPALIALSIAEHVLDVLDALHAVGVLHRDVKPESLLLTRSGVVKLLDLGAARLPPPAPSAPGVAVGTPAFMAPEQALGFDDGVDARADVFSVGATLFTMLSGEPVHRGRTLDEAFALAGKRAAPKLSRVAPEVDPAIAAVVDRALAYRPDDRYPTAAAMRADVLQLLEALHGDVDDDAPSSGEATPEPPSEPPPTLEPAPPTAPAGAALPTAPSPAPRPESASPGGPSTLPAPAAQGTLEGTPLAHLLIYMLDQRLGGTVVLHAPEGATYGVSFERGLPVKARFGRPVAPLDRVLVDLRLLDEATLRETLAESSQRKVLHGQVLVARGCLDAETLRAVLSVQLTRKLAHLFELPPATSFTYYDGVQLLGSYGGPEQTPCNVLEAIMVGARCLGEHAALDATLQRFEGQVLELQELGRLERFAMRPDEQDAALFLARRPMTLDTLLAAGVAADDVARRTAYVLGITRYLAVRGAARPPVGADHPDLEGAFSALRRVAAARAAASPERSQSPTRASRPDLAAAPRRPSSSSIVAASRPTPSGVAATRASSPYIPAVVSRPATSAPAVAPPPPPPAMPSRVPSTPRPAVTPTSAAPATPAASRASAPSIPKFLSPSQGSSGAARVFAPEPSGRTSTPSGSPRASVSGEPAASSASPQPLSVTSATPSARRMTPPPSRSADMAGLRPSLSPELQIRRVAIEQRLTAMDGGDLFRVLYVPRTATTDQVQQAYFAGAKILHPDRLPAELQDLRPRVTRAFARFNEAYQTLSDAGRRAEYERALASGTTPAEDQEKIARVVDAAIEFQKAEVLVKKRDLEGAEVLLLRAVQADPEQPEYLTLLCWVQAIKRGDPPGMREGVSNTHYDDLIRTLDHVLQKEPQYERALFYRGVLLKKAGRPERSICDFRLAAELNPKNLDAVREVRLFEMRRRTGGGVVEPPAPRTHSPRGGVPAQKGGPETRSQTPASGTNGLWGKLFKK